MYDTQFEVSTISSGKGVLESALISDASLTEALQKISNYESNGKSKTLSYFSYPDDCAHRALKGMRYPRKLQRSNHIF